MRNDVKRIVIFDERQYRKSCYVFDGIFAPNPHAQLLVCARPVAKLLYATEKRSVRRRECGTRSHITGVKHGSIRQDYPHRLKHPVAVRMGTATHA